MSYEEHEQQERAGFLENMMSKMDEQDRLIIENELFNSSDSIPLSTVFESIIDQEEARMLMGTFQEYLDDRDLLSREERQARARELHSFIDRRLT